MFCKYCGSSISSDAQFCPKCGKRLDNTNGSDTQQQILKQLMRTKCPWCEGKGMTPVDDPTYNGVYYQTCWSCKGTGYRPY